MTSTPQERSDYAPTGYQMIRSIDIKNFRCFQRLQIEHCGRLNVIVGDNGTGKTALLEAIFLPLCTSSQIPLRYRTFRGLEANFSGPAKRIEEAIWGDFFYHYNYRQPIQIMLTGDGEESRSVVISRGPSGLLVPLAEADKANATSVAPLILTWKDSSGEERSVTPTISQAGLQFPETGEDMPDFFMFPANQTIPALETADRFSQLSRSGNHRKFVDLFTKEYPWLTDITVEVSGGTPALYASVAGISVKMPLPNVSGGINRIISVLLAIASRQRSVVLVDEIENGIYHKHQTQIWRGLISFIREYDCQMFTTTHSEEALEALLEAANGKVDDINLWRMERGKQGPVLRQFGGSTFKAGLESGGELR